MKYYQVLLPFILVVLLCALVGDGRLTGASSPVGRYSGVPESEVAAPAESVMAKHLLGAGWAAQVSAGKLHTCALTVEGGVKCWGSNNSGQLGNGTLIGGYPVPVDVVGLSGGVQAVAVGSYHNCALTTEGGVKCWGGGGVTPADVVGLTSGVRAISAGDRHTCAITANGGVKCWGDNSLGQLGNGMGGQQPTPVDVVGLDSGVQMISAGYAHTCALGESGWVKCWGYNDNGELGDGWGGRCRICRTPVDVVGLASGVRAIAAGDAHTCAITQGGNIKCWGANSDGQLGDGTTRNRLTPVDVVGLTDAAAILSAGGYHTCAVLENGGMRCWGDNASGQLGDGTTTRRLMPVTGLLSGVTTISAGYKHTCAITAAGRVKCWGYNGSGQLGDGTTTTRLTPVEVLVRLFDCGRVTQISQRECKALVALFESTHGLLWRNRDGWLQDPTPCRWHGVVCAFEPVPRGAAYAEQGPPRSAGHTVIELNLAGNRLDGRLPPELGDLTALQVLNLSDNDYHLAGPLPAELGGLSALRVINLSSNWFAGPLPAEWGRLSALQVINLSSNWLAGPLPAEWGRLSALQVINLSSNRLLAGPLPAEWGNLTALRALDLHNNQFSGPLPAEWGHLSALQWLNMRNNSIGGPLPAAWGNLTALQELDLHNNQLSGPLPAEWGHLSALQRLDLTTNSLSGTLPAAWGDLTALQELDLHGNQLSGLLPAAWGQLAALRKLDLHDNHLGGPLPAAWGQLRAMYYLDLSFNELEGAIPPAWGDLTAVRHLHLNSNHLSGRIPAELGNLCGRRGSGQAGALPSPPPWPALAGLSIVPERVLKPPPSEGYFALLLASNHLSGPIPAGLSRLTCLDGMDLSGNRLEGLIPAELANLKPWFWFNLDYNKLYAVPGTPEIGQDVWKLTQTVPPTDLQAVAAGSEVILTWTPILYTGDGGFYEVSYATNPDGPFTVHGHTADKSVGSYTVTGLEPGESHYFRVRTFTPAHLYASEDLQWEEGPVYYMQQNDLWSDYSEVVSTAGATPAPTPTASASAPASPPETGTSTPTSTSTPTPSATASPTGTPPASPMPTSTSTPTPTAPPTVTASATASPTGTSTEAPTLYRMWLPLVWR